MSAKRSILDVWRSPDEYASADQPTLYNQWLKTRTRIVRIFAGEWNWEWGITMVFFFLLLACESSVLMKGNPDRKNFFNRKNTFKNPRVKRFELESLSEIFEYVSRNLTLSCFSVHLKATYQPAAESWRFA